MNMPILPDKEKAIDSAVSEIQVKFDFEVESVNEYLRTISGTLLPKSEPKNFVRIGDILEIEKPELILKEFSQDFRIKNEWKGDFPFWDGKRVYSGDSDSALVIEKEINSLLVSYKNDRDRQKRGDLQSKFDEAEYKIAEFKRAAVNFLEGLYAKSTLNSDLSGMAGGEVLVLSYDDEFNRRLSIENRNLDFVWMDLNILAESEGLENFEIESYKPFLDGGLILIEKESNIRFRYELNRFKKTLRANSPANPVDGGKNPKEPDISDRYSNLLNALFLENLTEVYRKISPLLDNNKKEMLGNGIAAHLKKRKVLYIAQEPEVTEVLLNNLDYGERQDTDIVALDQDVPLKNAIREAIAKAGKFMEEGVHSHVLLHGNSDFLELFVGIIRREINDPFLPIVAITSDLKFDRDYCSRYNVALIYKGYDFQWNIPRIMESYGKSLNYFSHF